jgi:hypothetical protein
VLVGSSRFGTLSHNGQRYVMIHRGDTKCGSPHPGLAFLTQRIIPFYFYDSSGYDGPWTPTPTTFNNAYFTLLMNLKWVPKEWDGPYQYVDAGSGKLMMLPT